MLLFPGYLKRLTVAYYLQALVPHAMPQDSAGQRAAAGVSRGAARAGRACWRSASIVAATLWVAGRAVEPGNTCWNSKSTRCPYNAVEGRSMTTKTRYFVIASLLVLGGRPRHRAGGLLRRVPDERLRQPRRSRRAPATCRATPPVVAFANVQEIMTSELRQQLQAARSRFRRTASSEFQNQTGINIETDIDHVVAVPRRATSRGTPHRAWCSPRPIRRREDRSR